MYQRTRALTLALLGCVACSTVPEDHPIESATIGSVTGNIDGVFGPPGSQYIQGWACETNNPASIAVHLYLDGPAGSGTLYAGFTADVASEQAVNDACGAAGSHRFNIPITADLLTHSYQSIWVHGISPDGGDNNLAAQSGVNRIPVAPFVKHGDNGAASCDAFCAGAQWGGRAGSCIGMAINNLGCTQTTGLLTAAEQTCTCARGDGTTFVKSGDNGTASCDAFCAGSQWGEVGTCVGGSVSANASAMIDGAPVAFASDCSIDPGFLTNGGELTCVCQPSDQATDPARSTVATGGTNSLGDMSMHDLAVASNTSTFRAGGGQLYIHEVGWLNTSEADRQIIAALFPEPPIFETGGGQAGGTQFEILPYWPQGASIVCVDTSSWPLPGAMPVDTAARIKAAWGAHAGAIGVYYTPNDGKSFNTSWGDPSFEPLRHALLTAGALCTDAPPQFYLQQPEAYKAWVAAEITWARAAGVTVVSALYPMSSGDEWADTQATVDDMLKRGAVPTTWAINGYYGVLSGGVPHPLGSEDVAADSNYTALHLLQRNGSAPQ